MFYVSSSYTKLCECALWSLLLEWASISAEVIEKRHVFLINVNFSSLSIYISVYLPENVKYGSPWSLEMPGLYQYLELSWTNFALTRMSASSLPVDWADPRLTSPTEEENVTWWVGEGAEETRRREPCPFRHPGVDDRRFFSGSGGWTGMVTAV